MYVTCSNQLNQLQSFLLHHPAPANVLVFGGGLFGFNWQGRNPPDRRGRSELHGQGCRLWPSQVTHLTHCSRRVVQIGTELTHPLVREGERERKREREREREFEFITDLYSSQNTLYKNYNITFNMW